MISEGSEVSDVSTSCDTGSLGRLNKETNRRTATEHEKEKNIDPVS